MSFVRFYKKRFIRVIKYQICRTVAINYSIFLCLTIVCACVSHAQTQHTHTYTHIDIKRRKLRTIKKINVNTVIKK